MAEHVAELVRRGRGLDGRVHRVELGVRETASPVPPSEAPSTVTSMLLPDGPGPKGLPVLCNAATGERLAVGPAAISALDRLEARNEDGDGRAAPLGTDADVSWVERVLGLHRLVRQAGFAHDQNDYEAAYRALFDELDAFEVHLAEQRWLTGGDAPSLADLWLFAFLVRFEVVYYGLYKCNRWRVRDREQLGGYLRDLYQRPGFADTVDWEAIKRAHYWEDARIGPKLRVPVGVPDLWAPHDRARRFAPREFARTAVEESDQGLRGAGEWVRGRSRHRYRVEASADAAFPAEAGRYHLYIANNCPWCHRVALTRAVKGLEHVVSMDVLYYRRDPERGWQFNPEEPGCTKDSLYGHRYIQQLYAREGSGEKSVPILFDRESERIVSNESAEIMRMLDRAFGALAERDIELCPHDLREQIESFNGWIYTDINNGAYKAGFTDSQRAYELAYARFFSAMTRLDVHFADHRFLCGDRLTEADLRLFPTMFRFDHVYYTRFRLDRARVRDHRHLARWLGDVYRQPGVAAASNLDHCKRGYFGRNANQVVPLGPDLEVAPAPSPDPAPDRSPRS